MPAPKIRIKVWLSIKEFEMACSQEDMPRLIRMLNMDKAENIFVLEKPDFFRLTLNHLLENINKIDPQQDSLIFDYIECLIESPTLQKIIVKDNIPELSTHFSYMALLRKDKLLMSLLNSGAFKELKCQSLEEVLSKPHFEVVGKLLTDANHRTLIGQCLEYSETQEISLFFKFARFAQLDLVAEIVGIIIFFKIDIVGCLLDAIPHEDKFIIHLIEKYNLTISLESLFILCEQRSSAFSRELITYCFNKYKENMLITTDLSAVKDQKGYSLFDIFLKTRNDNMHVLELLAKYLPQALRAINARGENALIVALSKKRYDVAAFLLSVPGMALDKPSSSGATARRLLNELRQSLVDEPTVVTTDTREVSETVFEMAVATFLSRHRLDSVDEIFKETKEFATDFLCLFLSEPPIAQYLVRTPLKIYENGKLVNFSQCEEAFYQAARKHHFWIPYRSDCRVDILSSVQDIEVQYDFLSKGTNCHTTRSFYEALEKTAVVPGSEFVYFDYSEEYSRYGSQVLSILQRRPHASINDNGYAFVISFCQDPDHVQCVLSIFDAYNQELPLTIIFNSSENEIYFQNTVKSINDGLEKEHPLVVKKMTYLNASLNVQSDLADKNCALYTLDIARALYNVLTKNVVLREMLTDSENDSPSKLAILKSELLVEIKQRLPQYFKMNRQDFLARSWQELALYFVQRRWEMGKDYISKKIKIAKKSIASAHHLLTQAKSMETPPPSLNIERAATFLPSRRRLSADKQIALQQAFCDKRPLKERLRATTHLH